MDDEPGGFFNKVSEVQHSVLDRTGQLLQFVFVEVFERVEGAGIVERECRTDVLDVGIHILESTYTYDQFAFFRHCYTPGGSAKLGVDGYGHILQRVCETGALFPLILVKMGRHFVRLNTLEGDVVIQEQFLYAVINCLLVRVFCVLAYRRQVDGDVFVVGVKLHRAQLLCDFGNWIVNGRKADSFHHCKG